MECKNKTLQEDEELEIKIRKFDKDVIEMLINIFVSLITTLIILKLLGRL